jgi:energy-coupling factor transporter ATP-binding protein EcfA2
MSVVRLIAEDVGPFDRVDVDCSDGLGRPHLGPHILAGVNGSGKSTLLRSIAWAMDWTDYGFPDQEWQYFLRTTRARALVHLKPAEDLSYVHAVTADTERGWEESLRDWVASFGFPVDKKPSHRYKSRLSPPKFSWARFGGPEEIEEERIFTIAAYAPSRRLFHVEAPARVEALPDPTDQCLGFESAIQNSAIQRWLVDLVSKRAIAKERGKQFDSYEQSLNSFQAALKLICGDDVRIDVELGPVLEPRLNLYGKSLNFSQLSDGIRTTVGWLADFLMRQDQTDWKSDVRAKRPGILLLDEIDIYLHPRWQRILLPAMRKALPNVQLIASSHSPFVISSCADARIHVLNLNEDGTACITPPQEAPFGESVTATLKDIFGVDSRFDVKTESDLKAWNDLKKEEAASSLTSTKRQQLEALTRELSQRSEELRLIVSTPQGPPLNLMKRPALSRSTKDRTKKTIKRKRGSAKLA